VIQVGTADEWAKKKLAALVARLIRLVDLGVVL
jgi:hypothetical protein